MKYLLDTHLLIWAATEPKRLPQKAQTLLEDLSEEFLFSAASIWEIAIKSALNQESFKLDARMLKRGLLDNGYNELQISAEHAIATSLLPPIHKDPFDRILVAQAICEGITLLTIDSKVAAYKGPVKKL